jgi:hypothetical protein
VSTYFFTRDKNLQNPANAATIGQLKRSAQETIASGRPAACFGQKIILRMEINRFIPFGARGHRQGSRA